MGAKKEEGKKKTMRTQRAKSCCSGGTAFAYRDEACRQCTYDIRTTEKGERREKAKKEKETKENKKTRQMREGKSCAHNVNSR